MQNAIQINEAQDQFLTQFRLRQQAQTAAEPEWLVAQRHAAIQSFQDIGFPTTHEEDWRYTNVSPIIETSYQTSAQHKPLAGAAPASWQGLCAAQLVFVNGVYSPELSQTSKLPAGVVIGNLGALLKDSKISDILRVYLGRTISHERHAFAALNSALWQDGACVLVPAGFVLEAPVQLIHISSADPGPATSHPRTLVVCERDSQVTVVETYQSASDGISFSNAVTEVVAAEASVVDLYKSVHEGPRSFHVGLLQIYAGRSSQISAFATAMSGSLVRNEVHALLDAEGADCTLNGLYTAKGAQHVDNHTTIDHAKPHCASRQQYNGILDGHASGVFNGRVIVRQDAQKTDAVQRNRNLLLSTDATIDTKPQLEISANDVRCTHGATVGQMDQEALFFLRSRGLDRDAAVSMLVQAFASEILDKVKIGAYRAWLEDELHTGFLGLAKAMRD
jgi:Fe-S cluster assembly protein SufD